MQLAQIQATASGSGTVGPPIPAGGESPTGCKVAAQQGLLGDVTPAEIEADAAAAVEELEDEEDLDDEDYEDDELDEDEDD